MGGRLARRVPGSGLVSLTFSDSPGPAARWSSDDRAGGFDGFDAPQLDVAWQFLRCPAVAVHSLAERPGWLRLKGQASGPGSRKTVAWVGRRVLHEHWTVRSRVDMPPPLGGARAGLCVIQNDENHLRLELAASSDGPEVRLVTRIRGEEWVVGRRRVGAGPLSLDLWCEGHTYSGLWSADGQVWEAVAAAVDGTFLTTESAGGFVGCMVGPFAVEANADFDWVDLRGYDE